jgi:type I restriction enzyme S subunit
MSLTLSPARIVEESKSPLLASPESWPRQPLGEVANILNGFAFKSAQFSTEKGKPIIRIRDIFSDSTVVNYFGDYEDRYVVRRGDFLVGMDGDFNCARWRGPEAILNQRVCKISPKPDKLDIDFLTYLLPGYLRAIHEVTSSMTVAHLSSRDVAQIPIPIPPLNVQRHLAELLGAAELKQQSAISHLGAARKAVLRFRNVVFAAGCSGRLTADWRTDDAESIAELPNGWKRITLGEIALTVTKGTTPTSYGHSFTDSGIGFIKVENLRDGRIDRESIRSFIAEATHQAQARSILQEGDILFSIAGTIGRTAIVHRDDLPANTNQALAIIRGTSRVVIPEYLVIALQGALRAVAADAARGSGMENISLGDVKGFELAVPPQDEQREIVGRVNHILGLVHGLRERIDAIEQAANRTSDAVLAKALRGALSTNRTTAARLMRSRAGGHKDAYLPRLKRIRVSASSTVRLSGP